MADSQQPPRAASDRAGPASTESPWPGWIALFLASLALYGTTASRGAQWQDSGGHILRVITGEAVNPLGLALSHPLHHWLGRLAVSVDAAQPCFAITLVSALAAAVAVANIYGCVLALTGRRSAALLSAASLGLAHTFWQMATVTETYTLAAALLSGECWCWAVYARSRRPGFLWLVALCNGLGIANHTLASLTTPVLVVVAWIASRRGEAKAKHVVVAAVAWLVGSAPYTAMVMAELIRTGDVLGTVHSALFGHSYAAAVLSIAPLPRELGISLGFAMLNFPNLLLPVALYGLTRARRYHVPTLARRVLTAALVLHVLFAFRYRIVDQHMFFLPTYVLLTIWGGIGFAAIQSWPSARARRLGLALAALMLAMTPAAYAVAPTVARRFDLLGSLAHNKPYRDDYVYLFTPWSVVERSAERMSSSAVELAGGDGLIVTEDPMAAFAIHYHKIRGGMDGLDIVTAAPPALLRRAAERSRPVVLVPLRVDAPRTATPAGSWRRVGDLYVLDVENKGKQPTPQSD